MEDQQGDALTFSERAFRDFKKSIIESLHLLTERERRVLSLRFGLIDGYWRTLEEVGRQFKVDSARIQEIEKRALKKVFPEGVRGLRSD
jgi:RNA polymerase primary sigma factor